MLVKYPRFIPKVALEKTNHKTQLSKFGLGIRNQFRNQYLKENS